jgi:hypothetical protein
MVSTPHHSPGASEPAALVTHPIATTPLSQTTPVVPAEEFFKHKGYDPSAVNMSVSYEPADIRKARITRETLELKTRLKQEALDRHHQRLKETAVYAIGIIVLLALLAVSIALVFNTNVSLEERSWGRTSITSILTAIGGYLFGSKGAK